MMPRILIATVTAAILALGLVAAYRARLDPPPARIDPVQVEASAADPSAPDVAAGPAALPRFAHPLQAHIASLTPPARDSVLLAILRDTGVECVEILRSTALDDGVAAWRVSCAGAEAYVVSVDELGGQHVDPLTMDRPVSPVIVPAQRNPADGPILRR